MATGLYKSSTVLYLGVGLYPIEEHKEAFDVVVSAGIFLKSHMPREGIREIGASMKKGGYWVTAMRDLYW
jgi:hypothetical protein